MIANAQSAIQFLDQWVFGNQIRIADWLKPFTVIYYAFFYFQDKTIRFTIVSSSSFLIFRNGEVTLAQKTRIGNAGRSATNDVAYG